MMKSAVYHVPSEQPASLLMSVCRTAAMGVAFAINLIGRMVRSLGYLFRTFVILPLGLMLFGFLVMSWGDKTQAPDVQAMVTIMEGVQAGIVGTEPGKIKSLGCAASPGCIPQAIPFEDQAHDIAALLRVVYAALVALILVTKMFYGLALGRRVAHAAVSSSVGAYKVAEQCLGKSGSKTPQH